MEAVGLFEAAREAHEHGETEQAYDQYTQAYQLAKQQGITVPGLLDHFAELCVAVEDKKLAKTLYKESIQAEPEANPQKYMSLAELEKGLRAAELYQAGIKLLTASKAALTPNSEAALAANSSLASAYAAVAELYMTDLCDEANAEETCERCVTEAIATDPSCVDGHQALANLRLIRGRLPEARTALDEVLRLLRTASEGSLPTPQFLAETARMLIELEMWSEVEEATNLGISQSEECDLLYMNAFAKFKQGKKEDCRDTLELLRERLKEQPDAEIEEATGELAAQVGEAMETD